MPSIDVPLRISGDIQGSPGMTLQGMKGSIDLEKGVILAKRHIHISKDESKRLGLVDGQMTSIRLRWEGDVILKDLFVRVGDNHRLAAHIDVDEGKTLNINKKTFGELISEHIDGGKQNGKSKDCDNI
ncbi:hypothetical protein HQ545_03135 [Candidatus Woesearchaeota archaeon]|nr:hypothetical protein [Candidatus Woesearchaeota archaeon]